ncbi:MAG: hypothetical protein HFI76_10410 [Lachnospiraceae bacterium]|nr:hypothetical protein [Lachnospiraceae bacterium]
MIILVNVVVSNSGAAGFYPWSVSYLLVTRRFSGQSCPKAVSVAIILAMCIWGVVASMLRFRKEEV